MLGRVKSPGLRLSALYHHHPLPKTLFLSRRHMATSSDADWQSVQPKNLPPYRILTKPIVKSPQDDRDYRIIKLDNGLEAMLIHDPKADKAAASLNVAVGHLFDPDDMPGLAHFCEHLLFMGTEQFPKENEYSEYLSKHSGSSNAYTSTTNTNYHFSVATSALPGALERFSGFFHSPLFSPSCTSRELNAVDSEHKKNHQADLWRIFQLNKHLSKPGHAWSKFGSGNRDSLSEAARVHLARKKLEAATVKADQLSPSTEISQASTPTSAAENEDDGGPIGREIRRRLVEWWEREYCASRMQLAVLGKESLDSQAEMVNRLFSPVKNRGVDPLPTIEGNPFGPDQRGTIAYGSTVMSFHAMEITFPAEYQPPFWKYKPFDTLSHFVGHEGPGSLFSYLKNKHWVTALSSGPQNFGRKFGMFKLTIYLTPKGFDNYRTVISAVFKYLALLRSSTLEDFHHQELVKLSAIRFRFAEKRRPEDETTSISENMERPYPRDLLIAGPKLTWDWENEADKKEHKERIRKYLDSYRIQECRVMLMAPKQEHLRLHPDLKWEKEPWYGTEFSVRRFDDADVKSYNEPNDLPELFLPGPNEFIPTNLTVDKKDVVERLDRPHLIRQTALSSLWHKKDDRFWVPKATVVLDIRSPLTMTSAQAYVLTRLYSQLVSDALEEFSYNADLAGLSYNLTNQSTGIYLALSGYNDKISILAQHVLDKAKNLVVNPERLEVYKEQNRRDWQNFYLGSPYSLSDFGARYATCRQMVPHDERLAVLPDITADDVQSFYKAFLSEANIRIFVGGNIYKDEAIKIAEMAEQGLGSTTLSQQDLNVTSLVLPPGINYVYSIDNPNPNQANSSLTYFVRYGPVNDQKRRVTGSLLTHILHEPAFNILRTREQLGYIVFCTTMATSGDNERGLRIVVQSERKPAYLEARVEAFLDEMKTKLEQMSEEEFAANREAMYKKWTEDDKNLREECNRFSSQVTSGFLDFLRFERDAAFLKSITKDDVYQLFMANVHPSSATRSKLSIHVVSQKPKSKQVSVAAVAAFEALVKERVPGQDAEGWKAVVEGETPDLEKFAQYWEGVLVTDAGKEVLSRLPSLVEEHPLPSDLEDERKVKATYIDDIKAFRSTLQASPDYTPTAEWNDLPTSKF